jgi:hypothetical protein
LKGLARRLHGLIDRSARASEWYLRAWGWLLRLAPEGPLKERLIANLSLAKFVGDPAHRFKDYFLSPRQAL